MSRIQSNGCSNCNKELIQLIMKGEDVFLAIQCTDCGSMIHISVDDIVEASTLLEDNPEARLPILPISDRSH